MSLTTPKRNRIRVGGRRVITVGVATALASTACVAVATSAPATPAAPALVRSAASQPVLRLGSTGSSVVRLQQLLRVKPVSGYFGPLTDRAVKTYQRSHGLPRTGVVATLTWGSLNRVSRPASSAGSASAARPVLRIGMRNTAVLRLQSGLRMPVVTGYFGTMTKAYVKRLQRAARLRQTGVVDKKTWSKVGRVRFSAPAAAAPAPAKKPARASGATAARVMAIARSLRGIPYVATGYSPSQGFNCSSYTQYVFQRVGINLGGAYTVTQYARSRHISRSQARPGDLIFYYNYKNDFLGHVGIYAGNGMFWHAPRTGRVVSLDPIYSNKVKFSRVI